MSIRIAVVGAGHHGQHHARILSALPAVELVAVVDANPARAQEIARLTGWSVPLVKVRAFRARAEMRKLLAKIAKDKYL